VAVKGEQFKSQLVFVDKLSMQEKVLKSSEKGQLIYHPLKDVLELTMVKCGNDTQKILGDCYK
jgi:hypothetical protein